MSDPIHHYIPALTERNGRWQRAACGAWIHASERYSVTPECPGCQAWLAADAVLDGEMAVTAAVPPDGPPVGHDPFDLCAGYRPKRGAR